MHDTVAASTGREVVRERRAVAALPPASAGASNVILIVWDTVRAYNISSYGYFRNTTPNLRRSGATQACSITVALATAPWTYPSHSCLLHRRVAVQAQFPVEVPSGRIVSDPGRSIWPLGAIKPPGSRRTPVVAATKPAWPRASPITKIIRSRRDPF